MKVGIANARRRRTLVAARTSAIATSSTQIHATGAAVSSWVGWSCETRSPRMYLTVFDFASRAK